MIYPPYNHAHPMLAEPGMGGVTPYGHVGNAHILDKSVSNTSFSSPPPPPFKRLTPKPCNLKIVKTAGGGGGTGGGGRRRGGLWLFARQIIK